ncbi:MAG: DMT family transporter [Clostridia bacterium]|nr:DMT family transporter [Clostridia bacterium]
MTTFSGLFIGFLYSVMNTLNAEVSNTYGAVFAPVIIHLTGAVCLWILFLFPWGKRKGPAPWYLYTGGLMGIVTVIASNLGVQTVGLTASLALMLLGQVVFSALFDHFKWFGAAPSRMSYMKGLGMLSIAAGSAIMIVFCMESAATNILPACALLLLSGLTIVMQRLINAALALKTGAGYSAIMNHTTGLLGSLAFFCLSGFVIKTPSSGVMLPFYLYLGGPLGAFAVMTLNKLTRRISNLRMTLLLFVGQIISGLLIDAFLLNKFSLYILLGAVFAALGLCLNGLGEKRRAGGAL